MMRDKLIEKRFIYFNRTKENCQKIILTSLYFQWQSPESLYVAFFNRYISQDQKYKQAPPQIKKVKNKQVKNKQKLKKNNFAAN